MGAGIKSQHDNTSQDASTASNITSNPQLESNLNGTTDVNPPSRKSGNTFTPDQQSAPYCSSMPNKTVQDGKQSYPDAGSPGPSFGSHIAMNGFQRPAGFAYMLFSFYRQMFVYPHPMNPN